MFDRQKVRDIRDQLNELLESYSKKWGVAMSVGRCTFTPDNITFKLQIAAIGEHGEVKTQEAEDFKFCAFKYGLKPEDLGKKFQYAREEYTIIGCKPRSYRFPILAKRQDGVTIKFPADSVKFALQGTGE